jgi:SLOG cluster2/TIR domain
MPEQPLMVHLLFHPRSGSARDLARYVHTQLNEDAILPGLRIPTMFPPTKADCGPPAGPAFNHAKKNCVVMLADNYLVVDGVWGRYAADVWQKCSTRPDTRYIPVQLTSKAWPIDDCMREVSFARAHELPSENAKRAFVTRRVVVELCRFLCNLPQQDDSSIAPVTLFLSHTKVDLNIEPRVTLKIIEALGHDQPIKGWVDSGDIPSGSRFSDAIRKGVSETSLLVILTDNYATREWCREEVMLAKEHQRPIAVVDALTQYEVRSFPFLGNVPRIRWNGNPQSGIDLLLKETLRSIHTGETLARFKKENDRIFTRPPEFATLAGLKGATVLYADPPLGKGEKNRLERMDVPASTPLERLALDRPVAGKRIALSMSESSDIVRYGMDELHFDSVMAEISRYLLIKGATLVYGGHLGKKGYTERLFELVRTHNNPEVYGSPVSRIVNVRGWPLPRLTVDLKAEEQDAGEIIEIPRPADINETLHKDFTAAPAPFASETSAAHRFAWARGMTEMREFQADATRSGILARIVLGGTYGPTEKVAEDGTRTERWYSGRIPGVLEEAWLSARAGQPVFLLGAFGGAARLVIDLLCGIDREEATWGYQKEAPYSIEMRQLYEDRGLKWTDYPEIVKLLRDKGVAGLNPLLEPTESERLFDSVDPLEIVELILLGLSKLKA